MTTSFQPSLPPLESNSPCTALAFGPGQSPFLAAGFQDGLVRTYLMTSQKVFRAIKSLGYEISCVAFSKTELPAHNQLPRFWVVAGKKVFLFDVNADALVLSPSDALNQVQILDEEAGQEDDVLNQISVNDHTMCFSADSGKVGWYDLSTGAKQLMVKGHSSIANCLGFIPRWPDELVSGGFDCQLLHHNVSDGITLSNLKIPSTPLGTSETLSLSPAFILSIAFADSGCLAASTADGRIWIGRKGILGADGKKSKKVQRWRGLAEEDSGRQNVILSVTQGPIVAVEFVKGLPSNKLVVLALSLSGKLQALSLRSSPSTTRPPFDVIWEVLTSKITKANALSTTAAVKDGGRWVTVGGVAVAGKGVVEVFRLPNPVLAR